MNDEQLKHYGIPGMRWGFRKPPENHGSTGKKRIW